MKSVRSIERGSLPSHVVNNGRTVTLPLATVDVLLIE